MKLFGNKRVSTRKHRKQQQHLLDVKVRAGKAREHRNRRILNWICALILVSGAVGGIVYGTREGLRRFVWDNPEYRLKNIEVKNEGGTMKPEEIIASADLKPGVNIFTVNILKVRESILKVPQIETAEVQRQMPDTITITVSERQPVAWVTEKRDEDPMAQNGSFLMDARGVLMKNKKQLPAYFHLPVIFGVQTASLQAGETLQTPEIKAALDLIRLNASDSTLQSHFQATGIDVSSGYSLVVTDRSHAQITFSLEHLEGQLDRLMLLLDSIEQSKRELQTVNLMVQRNIPVTFVSDADNPPPAEEAKPQETKTAKPGDKSASGASKKSQNVGQKKAVPVKKARAVNDDPDQARPVKKAIPVNTPNTKPNGQ